MDESRPRWDRVLGLYLRASRTAILSAALFMFVLMVGVNAYNIAARSLFAKDLAWSQELSIMAAMWVYFAAYALIAKDDAYVRVEFFVDSLPRPVAAIFHAIARVVTLVFQCAVLVFTFWALKVVAVFETHVLEWPEYVFYVPLLVASADIVVTELIHLARTFAGLPVKDPHDATLVGTGS